MPTLFDVEAVGNVGCDYWFLGTNAGSNSIQSSDYSVINQKNAIKASVGRLFGSNPATGKRFLSAKAPLKYLHMIISLNNLYIMKV